MIHKDLNGGSLLGACILIGAGIGALIGGTSGALIASNNGLTIEDGWDYVKHIVVGVAIGGTVGSAAGYVFAGTQMAASISWSFYKATHTIGTTAYAIGHAFEEWFYKAYNVVSQQVRHMGFRFDAVLNNTIIELKNYNWSKYSSYSSLIKRFTKQALNYLQFIGSEINGQIIKNVTFWFSSQPPQEIIDALRAIGVTVRWN